MYRFIVAVFIIFSSVSVSSFADVWVPEIFSEGMVLQRGKEITIWGTASPRERVAVTLRGRSAITRADRNGFWQAKIEPLSAGGPYIMNILGKNLITIDNVMIGDVWLVTGEPLEKITQTDNYIKKTTENNPVHFFNVTPQIALKPTEKIISSEKWHSLKEVQKSEYQLYHLIADSLFKKNKVPVAIIFSQYQEASLAAWINPDTLRHYNQYQDTLVVMERQYQGIERFLAQRNVENFVKNYPSVVYNTMVSPIAPYSIRGIFWHQNQSDIQHAFYTKKLQIDLINSFRESWHDVNLPFIILNTDISFYSKDSLINSYKSEFLEIQNQLQSINKVSIISKINEISSKYIEVIIKIFEDILNNSTIAHKAPKPISFKISGEKIKLEFFHQTSLKFDDKYGYGKGFSISGKNQKFYPAKAFLENDSTIEVFSDNVKVPVALRYSFSESLKDANLINSIGLNALPFKTDNWPGITDTSSFRNKWIEGEEIDTIDMVNKYHKILASKYPSKAKMFPKNLAEWESQKPFYYEKLVNSLGFSKHEWENRAAIRGFFTGQNIEFDDYTIRHVLYQSQPNFWVTANLYIPKNLKLPRPTILYLNGHSGKGKSTENYQLSMISLVKKGYVVMSIDETGAGERKFTSQHTPQFYLSGHSDGGWQIWDASRAVDFLFTQKKLVDTEKIGVTGRSGGGFQSFYLAATDSRVKAVAPVMYVSSFEGMIKSNVSHTIDNYLPSIRKYMEEYHILGLIAPKPVFIGAGSKDFFPIEATKNTISKAKQIYNFYNEAKYPELNIVEIEHKDTVLHRESVYAFFNKVFDTEVNPKEAQIKINTDSVLNVGIPNYSTFTTEHLANKELLNTSRKHNAFIGKKERLESLLEMLSLENISKRPLEIGFQTVNTEIYNNYIIEKLILNTDENINLKADFIYPSNDTIKHPVLIIKDPKESLKSKLINAGFAILSFSPRIGANTKSNKTRDKDDLEYLSFVNSIFLGKPLVGQKSYDYIRVIDYLLTRSDIIDTTKISLADIDTTLNSKFDILCAAALDTRIKSIFFTNNLLSVLPTNTNTSWANWNYATYIPNFSNFGNIQDIIGLIAPRKIKILNPKATDGSILSNYIIQSNSNRARYEYRKLNSPNNLSIQNQEFEEEILMDFLQNGSN